MKSKLARLVDRTKGFFSKNRKSTVHYRYSGKNRCCGKCAYYEEGKCKIVKGTINPNYVCDLFRKPI